MKDKYHTYIYMKLYSKRVQIKHLKNSFEIENCRRVQSQLQDEEDKAGTRFFFSRLTSGMIDD